jgi:hypothetical protein
MRKRIGVAVLLFALAIPPVAIPAVLANGSGQSCGDAIGSWHFVNNQTEGAAPGIIVATFSDGVETSGPSAVNQNTQHFIVESTGTLVSAVTDLPGRLVLSDFSCDGGKKEKK